MFGQIPDTLEDIWIQVATNNEQKAQEIIDAIPNKNPFALKYDNLPPVTEEWDSCITVLDKEDTMTQLMRGW